MVGEGEVVYGGFWRRLLAFWIDVFLVCAILFPALGILGLSDSVLRVDQSGVARVVIGNPLYILLAALFVYYLQATPGKMLLGLRVVDATTLGKPSFGQALGRQLSYILSILVFTLGFIWIAFDGRKQGWHDKLAGTVVIRRRG